MKIKNLLIFCILSSLFIISCDATSSSSDDSTGTTTTSEETGESSSSVQSTCGIISNGSLIASGDVVGDAVSVQASTPDVIVVRNSDGTENLVQLHGVTSEGVSDARQNLGRQVIINNSQNTTYVPVSSGGDCTTATVNGGTGELGQIITSDGESLTERLLSTGAVVPRDNGCDASALTGCYESIDATDAISSTVIRRFLWKPVSERDGKLVVLIDPRDITIIVEGSVSETLVDFGPSNGRGTTARGRRNGSGYGSNVRVRFFDSDGKTVLLNNRQESIIIPSGGSRVDTTF